MVKKSGKKKKKIVKKPKLTEDEQEEIEAEGELPKKSIRNREDRQLVWFLIVIGAVFALLFFIYFSVQSSNRFEYGGADWAIEDYENLRIYHGRFLALKNPSLTFNVFLRTDPRENDVPTEGNFNKFKNGGIISISPEANECRGELTRQILDLSSFLRQGASVGTVTGGTTDSILAAESGQRHAICSKVNDRTLVIVDIGEPRVVQDEKNPYCYTIYIDDCNDISPIEKFMLKSIESFDEVE